MRFVSACMKFFGRKKDQDLHAFIAETRDLTELDKTELTPLLEKELGEKIDVEPKA